MLNTEQFSTLYLSPPSQAAAGESKQRVQGKREIWQSHLFVCSRNLRERGFRDQTRGLNASLCMYASLAQMARRISFPFSCSLLSRLTSPSHCLYIKPIASVPVSHGDSDQNRGRQVETVVTKPVCFSQVGFNGANNDACRYTYTGDFTAGEARTEEGTDSLGYKQASR